MGNVTVSEKSIIIPNRGGNVNELRLYVRQGARLVLAKDASLMTETLETTGGADRVGPGSLVVEPGASIEVSGKLYYPSGPRTTNLGAITVKDIGTFTWDTDDISAYAIPVSLGTMTFEYGSSFYKNRVDPKLFFSAIGGEITTGNGTTIIITDKVFSFTGKYDDKSRTVVRDKETIDELNTRWLTRGGLVIDVVGVVVDLTANGAQIAVSTVNVKKPEKATGKGPFAKLIISSNTGGLGTDGLEILNVTDSTEVDIKAPAWVSLESGAGSGAKLNLTNATATIAAPANETASDLLVGLINGTDSKDAIVNYKGFDFSLTGLVVNTTDAGTPSSEAAIVGFSFDDPIAVSGNIELITPKKASFNGDVTITTGGVIITDAGTVEVFFGDTENSTTETLTVPQAFTITNSKVTVEAVAMGDTSSPRDLNLTKGSILTITDTFEFTDNQANTITLDTAGASDLSTIRGNPIDRTVAGTTTKSKPKILNTSSNSTSLAITAQDALGLLLTPPGSLPGTHSGGLATDEWSDWEVPSTGGSATWSAIKSP